MGKLGLALAVISLAAAAPASAESVFSDGFESGDFSAWSQVQTAGDGTASVQSAIVSTGSLAAQLAETANPGSKAYVRKTFDAARQDLTATGDFRVLQQGASGGNVPFFRFLDPASARIVSVYRQNGTTGKIGLTYGGSPFTTTGSLPLDTWGTVSMHVITNGASSTIEVRLNGSLIYQTTSASLGTAGVSTVQIGNDTAAQAFTLVADTIDVQGAAPAPTPPVNTQAPAISGTPQSGQTLTADPGSWTGTPPIDYAYEWRRCDADGANCNAIATGSTYTATDDDVGSTLRVAVTASNAAGQATSTSSPTAAVAGASSPPANTVAPTISQNGSGHLNPDDSLTANPGSWSGTQPIAFAYQWQRCNPSGGGCNAIVGATDPTYVAGGDDVGSTLRVAVTASNAFGSGTATSNPSRVVETVFSDGFESGDFSAWTQVQTAVDGTATVQGAIVSTGALAAQLSETASTGSKAYARKTLDTSQQDLSASGDFRVLAQGATGQNVPFFRFLDPSSARIVSVYRQNGTAGKIGVSYGGSAFTTTGSLPLDTWGTIELHVITNGPSSTVEVRLNGSLIYQTTSASLAASGLQTVQIGNDTGAQPFTLVADTIDVEYGASPTPSPPVNGSAPLILGTPQNGRTMTADPGSWSGTAPLSYSYEWQRCNSSGAACSPIATGSSYTATGADVGSTLRVAVTATNTAGSATATSTATSVVAVTEGTLCGAKKKEKPCPSPPLNTAAPTVSGTPQSGQTLTGARGSWSGTNPIGYAFQWQRCSPSGANCGAIPGATTATYVAAEADVGSTLRLVVTATNSAGSAAARSGATAVVQASVTPVQLVALWHMDETSGTVMHDAVGGHDGTLSSVQLGLPGFAGTAYGFTGSSGSGGSSSYVSVPSAGDLNPGSKNITVTLHLNTTYAPATPDWDLIRKGLYTTAGGEYKMEYQPTGQASCGFKGSTAYSELIAGPALNDGQWHTVQCVKTASEIKVVVDGQEFSRTATIGTIANTDPVPIGARPGSEFFKGSLDEASIQIGG